MSLELVNPFPWEKLSEAWQWHKNTKALTAGLGPEGFEDYFSSLLGFSPSWGIKQEGELVGFVLIEPTNLPGHFKPTDGQVHIALARKAWGGEVIQTVAFHIIPAFFAMYPTALRLSAWTVESNYPARAVADSLGFVMEGKLTDGAIGANGKEALLVYGLTRAEGLSYGQRTQDHNHQHQHGQLYPARAEHATVAAAGAE